MSYIDILANDKDVILFRPEINKVLKFPEATLILSQAIYWAKRSQYTAFYKFKEACKHIAYKTGDSWTEELGITVYGFDKGVKLLSDKGLISYWVDRKTNLPKYEINIDNLENFLAKIYSISKPKGQVQVSKAKPDGQVQTPLPKPDGQVSYNIAENTITESRGEPTFFIQKIEEEKEDGIKELLESKFPDLINFPALYKIVQAIENKAPQNYKEYINFVAENKKGEKVFIAKYWQEYFFEDFWVKNRGGSTETVHRHDLDMYQRDNETVTEFEARCISRENLGDVRIIKHYTKTTAITGNDLKSKFEMAKKAMLEAKTVNY